MYDDVRAVYEQLIREMEANMPLNTLQMRTCELFEELGHPTIRQDPLLQKGYVHGISHGIGLDIHELPSYRGEQAALIPGVIFTVEPGLYYPEDGMGCRLEDSYYVNENGKIEVLADYPYDLVLPIKEA